MVSDTLAVTNYLRQRFGRDRIYLMGHSGGTFIAIQAAAQAPELYQAYIGMAQMSDQLESERLAYDYMLREFKKNGNTRMLRKLEAAPVTAEGTPQAYLALRDVAMHSLGIGTMHTMRSVERDLFLESFTVQGLYVNGKGELLARQIFIRRQLALEGEPHHRPKPGGPCVGNPRLFPGRHP